MLLVDPQGPVVLRGDVEAGEIAPVVEVLDVGEDGPAPGAGRPAAAEPEVEPVVGGQAVAAQRAEAGDDLRGACRTFGRRVGLGRLGVVSRSVPAGLRDRHDRSGRPAGVEAPRQVQAPAGSEPQVQVDRQRVALVEGARHAAAGGAGKEVLGARGGVGHPPVEPGAVAAPHQHLDPLGVAPARREHDPVGLDLGEEVERLQQVLVAGQGVVDPPVEELDAHGVEAEAAAGERGEEALEPQDPLLGALGPVEGAPSPSSTRSS